MKRPAKKFTDSAAMRHVRKLHRELLKEADRRAMASPIKIVAKDPKYRKEAKLLEKAINHPPTKRKILDEVVSYMVDYAIFGTACPGLNK